MKLKVSELFAGHVPKNEHWIRILKSTPIPYQGKWYWITDVTNIRLVGENTLIADVEVFEAYTEITFEPNDEKVITEDNPMAEPTFKAGDEVEVMDECDGKWLFMDYAFFADGKHWVYPDCIKTIVHSYDKIRKPDPDKVYREIAKEIMVKRNVPIDTPESVHLMFNCAMVNEMLIEAIKKGKEL